MSQQHQSREDHDEPQIYEIRLAGHLDDRWAAWFDGMAITLEETGETVLSGPVRDQAALHGLLRKIRDLGLLLRSVRCLDPDESN
ncbi:MAG: hypothetical protein D6790_02540 [Caldilineae bacterium]|nr:MAG: hypothetical protein D6790_02540 [Caldilineae bacterium]